MMVLATDNDLHRSGATTLLASWRLRRVQPVDARGGTAARAWHDPHRRHVLAAAERGCSTAILQATSMAERVYAVIGFRDIGLILEFVPSS